MITLINITQNEYDLSYPLVIVINAGTSPHDSLESLSFFQIKDLLTMFFAHLNPFIIEYGALAKHTKSNNSNTILVTQILLDHHFFLKNRFKRMKSWIGLNSCSNDLSVSLHNCLLHSNINSLETSRLSNELSSINFIIAASNGTSNGHLGEAHFPLLPPHISSMNRDLSIILNSNQNFASFYSQSSGSLSTISPFPLKPSSSSPQTFDDFLTLTLKNINFAADVLQLSPATQFFIEEFLIESWNFPAHNLNYNELVYVCYLILKRAFSLFDTGSGLLLDDNTLLAFLFKVRDLYNGGNDFHNFRHAVDVVQAIFFYLLQLNLLPKHSIISKKMIVHKHRRNKNLQQHELNALLTVSAPSAQAPSSSSFSSQETVLNDIIDQNEQTIDNNDNLKKIPQEVDPLIEYLVYLKSPKLYLNQLKTYQLVIDQYWPTEPTKSSNQLETLKTEYGDFKLKPKSQLLSSVEVLALLIAALGHDSGHPGLTNVFITSNNSPLSTIFSDESVLENYHFVVFYELLKRFWPALFDQEIIKTVTLPGQPVVDVKKIISKSILATDMEKHFTFIDKIKNLERDASETPPLDGEEMPFLELSPELLCQLLLKCADISNITRPLKLSARWGLILGKEIHKITTLSQMFEYNQKLNKVNTSDFADLLQDPKFIDHVEAYEEDDKIELELFNGFLRDSVLLKSHNDSEQITEIDIANSVEETGDMRTLRALLENNPKLCLSQSFFIEKISYRLFEKINEILPWLGFTLIILKKNLNFWKLLKQLKGL